MSLVSGILVLAYGVVALAAPSVLAPLGVAPAVLLVLLGLHLSFSTLAKTQRRRADEAEVRRQLETATAEIELRRREGEETQGQLIAATRREAEAGAKVAALEKKNDGLRRELAEAEANAATPELLQAEIVSFLGLLQRKGRFIDFLKDDITRYDDRQVGAAARVVHQGCRAVLDEHVDIVPVRNDTEGTTVTLDKDYSPARYRLVGHVTGHPPFKGKLLHRGWMATRVHLPRVARDSIAVTRDHVAGARDNVASGGADGGVFPRDIIQPAEVELR